MPPPAVAVPAVTATCPPPPVFVDPTPMEIGPAEAPAAPVESTIAPLVPTNAAPDTMDTAPVAPSAMCWLDTDVYVMDVEITDVPAVITVSPTVDVT